MKMSLNTKHILLLAMPLLLLSCGGEKTDSVSGEALEAARMAGRNAAKTFVSREWKDSLELHGQLLEVAAERSTYTMQNRSEELAAFDSAFISTVRVTRPGLAERIERQRR